MAALKVTPQEDEKEIQASQLSTEEKIHVFANLILDRIFEELAKGSLPIQVSESKE